MKPNILKTFNHAWETDGWVLSLVPYRWNPEFLEGETPIDKDIIRRATFGGVIRSEKQYTELSQIVSEWGYCIQTPYDFQFSK